MVQEEASQSKSQGEDDQEEQEEESCKKVMSKSFVDVMRQASVHKDMLALIDNASLTSRKTFYSESSWDYPSGRGDTL